MDLPDTLVAIRIELCHGTASFPTAALTGINAVRNQSRSNASARSPSVPYRLINSRLRTTFHG
jgi:hypothetical protein